jgi:hypothetical protein
MRLRVVARKAPWHGRPVRAPSFTTKGLMRLPSRVLGKGVARVRRGKCSDNLDSYSRGCQPIGLLNTRADPSQSEMPCCQKQFFCCLICEIIIAAFSLYAEIRQIIWRPGKLYIDPQGPQPMHRQAVEQRGESEARILRVPSTAPHRPAATSAAASRECPRAAPSPSTAGETAG